MQRLQVFAAVFILFFLSPPTLLSQSIDNQLNEVNALRSAHFEKGEVMDTVSLDRFTHSKSSVVSNLSQFIRCIYNLERFQYHADKRLIDFINRKKIVSNKSISNFTYLAIDDLFRICMASKRYMLFHQVNILLFSEMPLDLMSSSYNCYVYLKTGSIYKYLDQQNIVKHLFINSVDSFKNSISEEVFDRLKLNVVSIGISNYDTIDQHMFHLLLKKYVNPIIDTNSSIESIIFANELSNYNLIPGFESYNTILSSKLVKEFSSAFVLNVSYYNFNWLPETKKTFLDILFWNNYGREIFLFQSLDLYVCNYERLRSKRTDELSFLGKIDLQTFRAEELSNEIPEFGFIDTVLKSNYLYEPNWLYLQVDYTINQQGHTSKINDALSLISGNINDSSAFKYAKISSHLFSIYKKYDYTNLLDCSNIYLGPYYFVDEIGETSDCIKLLTDTIIFKRLDSLYRSLIFCKKINYFQTNSYTSEKDVILRALVNFQSILLAVFKSSKKYDIYEDVSDLLDISDFVKDSIPVKLRIVKDKIRYLNFIKNSSTKEINEFDSLFVNQIKNYILNPLFDTLNFQNRYYFYSDISKNILLDIYERKNISDSLLITFLSTQEIISLIISRMTEDFVIYNQAEDSIQPISNYRNPYFCIDNKELKIKVKSDTLFYRTLFNYNNLATGKTSIDSSIHAIWYFVADDYSAVSKSPDAKDFDKTSKYLFVAISDAIKSKLIKLISIDSLSKIINIDFPKSTQYFSSSYFSDLDRNSELIYKELLYPIESFIDSSKEYKLLMPSNLVTLPLDYIFLKERDYLPHFNEYSDITGLLFKSKGLLFSKFDSVSVFYGMVYNDIYCNINKAYTPTLRSGIVELEYSNTERDEISKSLPIRPFSGINASKYNFIRDLLDTTSSNIHVITHGAYVSSHSGDLDNSKFDFSTNASISGLPEIAAERQLLLFSSDSSKRSNKNNILVSYEIRYLDDLSHIKNVFLSACETGLIEDRRSYSSGYSGFIREFIDRGVQSIIATRWKIQDKSAAEFASLFYKNLALHKNYSVAFYQTKLQSFRRNTNPAVWTSYLLIQ